jgi:hypothetical protein
MTAPRQRTGNLLVTRSEQRPTASKLPTRKFPVQREIQKLERDLNALNERIAELEDEGHRGHAMDVLMANAMDFARRIDELRCLLSPLRRLGLHRLSKSKHRQNDASPTNTTRHDGACEAARTD